MNKKKVIKNESELKKWFVKNYKKLGYSKIVRKDISKCPDFIMLKNGKEVQVELETTSSNFLTHKHQDEKVDEVVCMVKDVEIKKPVIVVGDVEFNGNVKVTLSINKKVYKDFQKYCEDNAIQLSKKIELFIKKFLQENLKRRKEI